MGVAAKIIETNAKIRKVYDIQTVQSTIRDTKRQSIP